MLYADTCYLVKYYCVEPGTAPVRKLFEGSAVSCLALGKVELVASFHRKLREGAIDRPMLAALMRQLQADDSINLWNWLPVTEPLLEEVSRAFAALPDDAYLRAMDAMHLTAARMAGLRQIYSNDRHVLAAAPLFGLRGVNVLTSR